MLVDEDNEMLAIVDIPSIKWIHDTYLSSGNIYKSCRYTCYPKDEMGKLSLGLGECSYNSFGNGFTKVLHLSKWILEAYFFVCVEHC